MHWSWIGLVWVIAGILILVFPHLINWLIGVAVIIVGVMHFIKK